jgi:hypothetical protein
MQGMLLPTFLVAGAPRAGTTSLHYYLRQHPQVCLSIIKEPNFFLFGQGGPLVRERSIIRKSVRSTRRYAGLFRAGPATRAIGEVSPLYLYTSPAIERIVAMCGLIPILCVLRRPVARAWSHFLYAFPDVPEVDRQRVFSELVTAEMRAGPDYAPYRTRTHLLRLGLYDEQVRRYQEAFGEGRVTVMLSEDLERDGPTTLLSLCRAIGVTDDFDFDLAERFNTATPSSPRSGGGLGQVMRALTPTAKRLLPPGITARLAAARVAREPTNATPQPGLDPSIAGDLAAWCAADVDALAARLGRDLSSWQTDPLG